MWGGGGGGDLEQSAIHLKPPKFEHIFVAVINFPPFFSVQILLIPTCCLLCVLGGTTPFFPKLSFFFCTCHNFSPLSSVQIIIIPACCLLCVL